MKRTNVYLDEEQSRLLRHLAVQEGRSFTDLVREALNAFLAQRGLSATSRVMGPRRQLPDDEWGRQLEGLLQRARARSPAGVAAAEAAAMEADVTAARQEVRAARRGRPAHGGAAGPMPERHDVPTAAEARDGGGSGQ